MSDYQKSMTPMNRYVKSTIRNEQPESKIQNEFCDWVSGNYPDAYYQCDASSLGASWSTKTKVSKGKSGHAHLDFFLEKKSVCGRYSGLVIEFKADTPFKINGELKQQKMYDKRGNPIYNEDGQQKDHLNEQRKSMELLTAQGRSCHWAWSLNQAMEITIEYLGQPKTNNEPLFP